MSNFLSDDQKMTARLLLQELTDRLVAIRDMSQRMTSLATKLNTVLLDNPVNAWNDPMTKDETVKVFQKCLKEYQEILKVPAPDVQKLRESQQ
jgi:hypothetical protein